jgi:peptidoglycan/LPS O-acetylase OafA/YrhL
MLLRGDHHFYLSRCLRILPPYFIALLLYRLGVFPSATNTWPNSFGWLMDVLLLGDFVGSSLSPVFWSLAVEAKFYLLAPVIRETLVGSRRRRLLTGVALAAIPLMARLLVLRQYGSPTGFDQFFWRFRSTFPLATDGIALGVLLAGGRFWGSRVLSVLARLGPAAAAILVAMMLSGILVSPSGWSSALLLQTVVGWLWFCVFVWVRHRPEDLRLWWLGGIGRISYSVYLVHFPVMAMTLAWCRSSQLPILSALVVQLIVMVSASLTSGAVFYLLVERPSASLSAWVRSGDLERFSPRLEKVIRSAK